MNKRKIRSVQKGDVFGKVYTLLDEREPLGVNEEESVWTQEELKEAISVDERRKNDDLRDFVERGRV